MKQIEIVVSPQGDTRITTKGFIGAECQQASRFLETALGQASSETLTPEFHETACERSRVTESN
jgi:Protein of unknown function (DUF2997)